MNVNLTPMIPELTLVGGFILLMVIDLLARRNKGTIAAIGGSIVLAIALVITLTTHDQVGEYMFGAITLDGTTTFFRVLFCLAGIISFGMMSFRFKREAEPFLLVLASTVGMFFLAGANDVITLFVALEMVSIPSYVLAGYLRKDPKSAEAALKYVLFGAVSTGIMLFGFAIMYGLSGTTRLPEMAAALQASPQTDLAHMLGVVLILAGIGYKIAMVPFHFWCPDVYEGSPTSITAYFSVAPKAAGFAALFRLMPVFITLDSVMGVTVLSILTLTSAMTMTWGNLSAIWQNSVKRLLAYSSIAHAGYILMGFAAIAAFPEGEIHDLAVASVLFYLVVYMFMNFGAFLVVDMVDRNYGGDGIKWFRGLGKNSPMPALVLAICLFSLTGIPPLAGFIGKFYLLAALVKGKMFILPLFAIANTAVSLFYYVRIVRDMFLYDPEGDVAVQGAVPPRFGALSGTLAVVTVIPTIVLGIFWNQLAQWINLKVW